ncbi:ribonuclease H-like domain-containing protein [Glaciimonas sp. PCH181]|uniref:ribonuclease H-like domain-containing protein n=1 Tax=Glaciimonas sp. PCH181 TaxID=2133943 RepID=UPI000D356FF0|nr:ribonuclease H-like domain-containing protein [Glaciimonas sp. PCH181]PUA19616.1 hypothetical protein C7W93_07160 [Glaciimonas sp. PCH181]
MNFVIDIETCPSQDPSVKAAIAATIAPPGNISKAETIDLWNKEKKPGAVEDAWRRTSFDGSRGHICVIGVAVDDADPVALCAGAHWYENEAYVLTQLFEFIDAECAKHPNVRPTFIGHNVIDFDLRFIFQRAVILGVTPSRHIPFAARPWDDAVYDTMTRWSGTKDRIKLDHLAKALGLSGKGDIDGSMVWDYVNSGRIDEVAQYCCDDVSMTRDVHRRMTFLPAPVIIFECDGLPF